jgi:catechol 2,3-dioxygenase-like lactoylglutathione lyase family enzyme
MKFKMSTNFAVRTKDIDKVKSFYSDFFGFTVNNHTPIKLDLDANSMTLYAIKDKFPSGLIMELIEDNLENAKEELISKGYEIIKWGGKGKDCYIKDLFRVIFNIWEEKKERKRW